MKKTFTTRLMSLAAIGLSIAAFGQAPRLVLAEEFTQASCGPCASQNPAFNALLQANPTKIIDIKYQTSWPGFDPMNLQNPAEVQSRVTYYGVNGVPNLALDGSIIPNDCNAYAGAPACLDQSEIDGAYNTSTPISVSVTHTMAADLTSATVDVTVTNVGSTDFVSNGNLYFRLALVETEINFPTPPGSNGEEDFYGVMRKMVPNATGSALPSTMTAGQTWTNQFTVPMPSYIYNYGEIAFVGFVQSDGDKMVHNAAHSAATPVPPGFPDAATGNASTAGADICDASFTPAVTITNNSSTVITSADAHYTINGGAAVTQSWTGSLNQGASATITFPATTLGGGNNVFEAYTDNVNGQIDFYTLNNAIAPESYSVVDPTPQMAPYERGFESNAIGDVPSEFIVDDPSGRIFIVDNQINSSVSWQLGGFEQSDLSLRIDFYSIQAGVVSDIITEKVDLTSVNGTPELYFDNAYAQYTNENDALDVAISTDCGATWTSLWSAGGAQLATAAATTARFYPRANQWNRQAIDLSAYASSSDALFRFRATSAFGNSLYIDNIFVSNQPIGIEENEIEGLSLFPVPAEDHINVRFDSNNDENLEIRILNQLGAVVAVVDNRASVGMNEIRVDLNGLSNGLYTLDIRTAEQHSVRKITVIK
jgi:archaellum component FlaF (FlaF/FlaG flagellin family)